MCAVIACFSVCAQARLDGPIDSCYPNTRASGRIGGTPPGKRPPAKVGVLRHHAGVQDVDAHTFTLVVAVLIFVVAVRVPGRPLVDTVQSVVVDTTEAAEALEIARAQAAARQQAAAAVASVVGRTLLFAGGEPPPDDHPSLVELYTAPVARRVVEGDGAVRLDHLNVLLDVVEREQILEAALAHIEGYRREVDECKLDGVLDVPVIDFGFDIAHEVPRRGPACAGHGRLGEGVQLDEDCRTKIRSRILRRKGKREHSRFLRRGQGSARV